MVAIIRQRIAELKRARDEHTARRGHRANYDAAVCGLCIAELKLVLFRAGEITASELNRRDS